jgi:hypothetical protein
VMLVASDPVGFEPAPKRRLPPPLLASPGPVARDPASPLARACRSCGRTARPACSWRGVRSRQAGAGMNGRMTRWSSPSPSPAARRFRERSCRPSWPLPRDLRDAFPLGFGPVVQPSCDRQAGWSARRNVHPPVGDWWNENLGFAGLRRLALTALGFSAVSDEQRLRLGGESRKKFQMQLCTAPGHAGG